jgi:hypothetical protein
MLAELLAARHQVGLQQGLLIGLQQGLRVCLQQPCPSACSKAAGLLAARMLVACSEAAGLLAPAWQRVLDGPDVVVMMGGQQTSCEACVCVHRNAMHTPASPLKGSTVHVPARGAAGMVVGGKGLFVHACGRSFLAS